MTCVRLKGRRWGSGFGRWWPLSSDGGLCWVPLHFPSKFRAVRLVSSVMGCCIRTVAFQVHRCTDGNVHCNKSTHFLIHGPAWNWKICPRRKQNVTGTVLWRKNGWQTTFVWRWKQRFVVYILNYLPAMTLKIVRLTVLCLGRLIRPSYRTAATVRYYLTIAFIFLWSPLSCQHQSRPFSSSSVLHLGSCQRLATQNQKTEANLAENGWGWSILAWQWQGSTPRIDRRGDYSWRWLCLLDMPRRGRTKSDRY